MSSMSTIPANSAQDGDEETVICTGVVEGKLYRLIDIYVMFI